MRNNSAFFYCRTDRQSLDSPKNCKRTATLLKATSLEQDYAECKRITESHYENFPVASVLLPAEVRKHVYPIYAFARHADDLADEDADRDGLLEWQQKLHRAISGSDEGPVFRALSHTIAEKSLPVSLFDDLISAFLQDLEKTRYADYNELYDYCRRSANPVGRLILLLHGYTNYQLMTYSDHICTALQLANFWQDVSVDIQKERIYMPLDLMTRYGVSEENVRNNFFSPQSRDLARHLIADTREEFKKGVPLLQSISGRLRLELKMTVAGGVSILDKIKKNSYDIVSVRPTLSKWDWVNILRQLTFNRQWYNEHTDRSADYS